MMRGTGLVCKIINLYGDYVYMAVERTCLVSPTTLVVVLCSILDRCQALLK